MTIRERFGLAGLVLVGAGALLVSFVSRPFVTPALATDGDGDGLSDAFETAYGTNPAASDTDGDTVNDWTEIFVKGTDPTNVDTDGDGTNDNADANPLDDGTDADGRNAATMAYGENLTAPAWTGTSVKDGKCVYPHSGEFMHSLELLRIDPGYGPSMDLTISYRSGITYDGPVGMNWSWLPGVQEQVNHDIIYWSGDGRSYEYEYHHPGGPDPDFWTPPPDGVFWPSMVKNGGGDYTLKSIRGDEQNFSSAGDVTTVKDRFGNTVTYGYTTGQCTSITDATGHQVTVAWYGTGRVQTLTDDDGRVVTLTYNCFGQLAKVTTPATTAFPSGRTYQFVYSNGSSTTTLNDNMVRAKDPKGQIWLQNQFDSSDRITKQYLGNDYFTFAYNGGGVTEVHDREDNKREWTISGVVPTTLTEYSNRNVRGSDYGNDDPSTWVTTFGHDATTQQRTKVVYPNGNRVDTDYDSAGCPTEIRRKTTDTNSDSNTNDIYESFAYDNTAGKYHLMTSHTDERGNVTTYTLDTAKKVVETVSHPTVTYPTPDQSISETLTWNAYGQLVTVTDGEGYDRTNIYNCGAHRNCVRIGVT